MYYDIGDIETQGQRLQIESIHPDLEGIEGFEANNESGASLPLWLAAPLARIIKDGEPYTQIKPHPIFGVDVLNALKSDPRNVDLYAQSPVYYELALEWLLLFGGDDLQEVLVDSIKSRTASIFERASSLAGPDQRYEAFERQTYLRCLEQRLDAIKFVRS